MIFFLFLFFSSFFFSFNPTIANPLLFLIFIVFLLPLFSIFPSISLTLKAHPYQSLKPTQNPPSTKHIHVIILWIPYACSIYLKTNLNFIPEYFPYLSLQSVKTLVNLTYSPADLLQVVLFAVEISLQQCCCFCCVLFNAFCQPNTHSIVHVLKIQFGQIIQHHLVASAMESVHMSRFYLV